MRQYQYSGAARGAFIAAITAILAVPFIAASLGVADAVSYVKDQTQNPWTTMALVAADEDPSTDHLTSVDGDTANAYSAPILALTAADKDPRTYPDENYITQLMSFHSDGQLGDVSLLNDDIFGILALASAGEGDTQAANDAVSFLLAQQNDNGSWGYSTSASGDTNTTAGAVMALHAAGKSADAPAIADALDYLKNAQNSDGGFPYSPGGNSDASSDAWVLSMLHVLDINVSDWSVNGNTPRDHLKTLQESDGYFAHTPGDDATSFTPTETAYAVIALEGEGYPVEGNNDSSSGGDTGGGSGDESTGGGQEEENDGTTGDGSGSEGDTTTDPDLAPSVAYEIVGPEDTICDGTVRATTALAVIENAAEACDYDHTIEQTDFGPYVKSIAGHTAEGSTGWLYTVNWQPVSDISKGAADYILNDHDHVLWMYDTFSNADDRVKELKGGSTEVPLEVTLPEQDDDDGTDDEEEEEKKEISFTVTDKDGGSPSFTFDEAERGDTLTESVVLTNTGDTAIEAASTVSGDSLFRNHLTVGGVSWRDFGLGIDMGAERETEIGLTIPEDYAESGTKEGTLVFWVTPQD